MATTTIFAGFPTVAPAGRTLANGSGVAATALVVDDATGFDKGVNGLAVSGGNPLAITVGGVAASVTACNLGTKTLTLAVAKSWSDDAAVVAPNANSVDITTAKVAVGARVPSGSGTTRVGLAVYTSDSTWEPVTTLNVVSDVPQNDVSGAPQGRAHVVVNAPIAPARYALWVDSGVVANVLGWIREA